MNQELNPKQEMIVDEIKQLEKNILEISMLGQFETAKSFTSRLEDIKNRTLLYYSKNSSPGLSNEEASIIRNIAYLEYDIKVFFIEKGNALKAKKKSTNYQEKMNSIIKNMQGKTTKELWKTLLQIVNDWKIDNPSTVALEMEKKEIAKIVLKLIELQISRNEVIDLNMIEQYCDYDDFLSVVKERLIDIAQEQDMNEQKETLSVAKNLNRKNLADAKLWHILTYKKEFHFFELDNTNNYSLTMDDNSSTETRLTTKTYDSILSNIMLKLYLKFTRKDAKFVYAKKDSETGEYIKTIEKFDTFYNYDAWNPPIEEHLELLKIISPDFEIEGAEELVQFLSQKGYLTFPLSDGKFGKYNARVRVTYGTINPISKKIENMYSRYMSIDRETLIDEHHKEKIIQIVTPEKFLQDDREIVKFIREKGLYPEPINEFIYKYIDEATGIVTRILCRFETDQSATITYTRKNFEIPIFIPPFESIEIIEINTEKEKLNTETDILRYLTDLWGIDTKVIISRYPNWWKNKSAYSQYQSYGYDQIHPENKFYPIKSRIIYCALDDIAKIDGNIWHINQLVTNRKNIENVIQCDDCLRITDLILLDDATNLDVSKLHCGRISNIKRSKAPITVSFPIPEDR